MKNLDVLPSELVHEVMSAAEQHHAGVPISSAFFFGLGEWLRRPIFVMAGAEGAVTLAAVWVAVITVLAAIIFGMDVPFVGESRAQKAQFFQVLTVLITASFVLTHPSRIAFLHVNPRAVHEINEQCIHLQNASQFDLDACDRTLSIAEKICGRRITVLWFFPATGWALSAYLLQHELALGTPDLSAGLIAGILTLFVAGATAAYSRSVWAVFGLSSAVIELQRKRVLNKLPALQQ